MLRFLKQALILGGACLKLIQQTRLLNSCGKLLSHDLKHSDVFWLEYVRPDRLHIDYADDIAADFQRQREFCAGIWQQLVRTPHFAECRIIHHDRLTEEGTLADHRLRAN